MRGIVAAMMVGRRVRCQLPFAPQLWSLRVVGQRWSRVVSACIAENRGPIWSGWVVEQFMMRIMPATREIMA